MYLDLKNYFKYFAFFSRFGRFFWSSSLLADGAGSLVHYRLSIFSLELWVNCVSFVTIWRVKSP